MSGGESRESTQPNEAVRAAKPEVSGVNLSPPTSVAPTSELINTAPNRPTHLTEDRRRHRRAMSHRAKVCLTITVLNLRLRY